MNFKYKKVIIVEDNELDRYVLETLVRNNNFSNDVINFSNGLEAINFLELNKNNEENLPDIIFLDIYMPLMDGHEFMELFSKINFENSSKCKVFVISNFRSFVCMFSQLQ